MGVQNPIIHASQREVLFLYGVIESCMIRTHYKLQSNLFSVRVVRISNYASTYAHAWVQNPIIHPYWGDAIHFSNDSIPRRRIPYALTGDSIHGVAVI